MQKRKKKRFGREIHRHNGIVREGFKNHVKMLRETSARITNVAKYVSHTDLTYVYYVI